MKKLNCFVGIIAIAWFFLSPEISYGQVKIGDFDEGGIVFYVDSTGKHGLVCQTKDLGKMNWQVANKACEDLGGGWRLPAIDELKLIYENLHEKGLGGFGTSFYWSSTEFDGFKAWVQVFALKFNGGQTSYRKGFDIRVRAVREF